MLSPDGVTAMRRAMCLTMVADGRVVPSELELLATRWEELSGSPFDAALFDAEAREATARPDALLAWLQSRADALDPAEKAMILKAAVHMLMADAELEDAELVAVRRIARALAFPDLKSVMNAAWREARAADASR